MYKNGERAMAWVAVIDAVERHPNADSLDICTVGGWRVVAKLGEFNAGDLAIYVSIDSWVPTEIAAFLSKGKEPREYNGVRGERLRTVKLRGTVSQGLLLSRMVALDKTGEIAVGMDVSQLLNIQKWEAPVPAQLAGQVRGMFPSFIPKTDQERIQNLASELKEWAVSADTWNITEKLDGSSMTVYIVGDDVGVCSRNLDLKEDAANSFWRVAKAEGLIEILRHAHAEFGVNIALQGELIGEGIQGNHYRITGQTFRLFDVYDIDAQRYWTLEEKMMFCDRYRVNHVPIVHRQFTLSMTMDELLKFAEVRSGVNPAALQEGYVFVNNRDPSASFKVISNEWLIKHES